MNKLNATQVAVLVGVTVPTLNSWYKWKKLNPDHEMTKYLPDYTTIENGGRTRYWNQKDVGDLITFRMSIPRGQHGIMGEVTQKYVKKGD